jgi:DNA repair exonuclease SbcCD ATPase subunit
MELQTIVSWLNIIGLGGVGIFLYYLYKGLSERINTLTEVAREQTKTLEAVRTRAEEMDRLRESYKQAVSDFQEMGDKLEQRRSELVKELEAANQRKDAELAKLASLQLEELELQKRSLERIPKLEENLQKVVNELQTQLKILSPKSLEERESSDVWSLASSPIKLSSLFVSPKAFEHFDSENRAYANWRRLYAIISLIKAYEPKKQSSEEEDKNDDDLLAPEPQPK